MSAPMSRQPPLDPAASSPAARRPPGSTWRDPRLAIGIAIVAVCVLLGAKLLGGADDTVGVWALRAGMSSGAAVEKGDLVRRDIGFSESADADRYLSADADVSAGSTLLRDVGAGELLPRAAIGTADQRSLVEVPLSVNSEFVPATVRGGSVVDVWVTPEVGLKTGPASGTGDGRTPFAELVFNDVTVVSAPLTGSSLGPSATRQIIVGVDSGEEADLPQALAKVSSGTIVVTKQG